MVEDERVVAGRYRLGTRLGRGGMAEVFLGLDVRLCRAVAVKRLRRELGTDPGARELFEREAVFAGGLNHPNIVAVYDAGETEDPETGTTLPYLVLELATGRSLKELMRDGQTMAPAQALQVTDGLLAALAHSHAAGVVHSDVKPANVVLTLDGDAKLTDFGIARLVGDGPAGPLGSSEIRGTTRYLAPERFRGGTPDPRSDLYSVGCLLYQLVVGHPPFSGASTTEVARHHLFDPPTPPSQRNPQLDPRLDGFILTALAKDPAERHQSAEEMRSALRCVLVGEPPSAPLTSGGTAVLAAARHRKVAATSSRTPRRRTLVAAGLAAMLVPGAGVVVRSADISGGRIEEAGAAAALSLPWGGSHSGSRQTPLAGQLNGAAGQPGAGGIPLDTRPGSASTGQAAGVGVRSTLVLRGWTGPATATATGSGDVEWASSLAGGEGSADAATSAVGSAGPLLPLSGGAGAGRPQEPDRPTTPVTTPPTPTEPGRPQRPGKPAPTTVPQPPTTDPRPIQPAPPPRVQPPAPARPTRPVTAPRPAKPAAPRPVKSTKPGTAPRPAKPTRPTKPVIAPRPAKPTKPVTAPRPAKPTKPVTAPRPAKPAKPTKLVAAKPDKPTKPVRAPRPEKPTKPDKP